MRLFRHLQCLIFVIKENNANEDNASQCIPSCSDAWGENDSCCYLWPDGTKTWKEAEDDCIQKGGHLASITNERIDNYIRSKVHPAKHHVNYNNFKYPWLGGSDSKKGEWRWTDGSQWNFTKWGNAQPNDFNQNQKCLQMNRHPIHDGWNDYDCEAQQRFVCSQHICPNYGTNNSFPVLEVAIPSGIILIIVILIIVGCTAKKCPLKKEEVVKEEENQVYGVYQLNEAYERQYSINVAIDNNDYYQ